MKIKILYLILFILIFIPIGLCEKFEDIKELNNTKIYDKNKEIIDIYDKNNDKSMSIKLISTISDIDRFIKIIEITNFKSYIPDEKNDFITKTKKIYGKNNVYKIEYFIEKYNYTFDYIIINKTIYNNKTGKNESKLINKTIIKDIKPFWVKFESYKQILKNEKFKLKIIHYKKPEIGFFKIQTIPIFKNIECEEFTWWDGNWNLRRPILINNIYGDNVTDYQLKSVNLSQYQINATSTRIINETSGLQENFWNESINSNGNLEYVWCNFSKINNGSWINDTFYLYYQSIPNVNSVSNGSKTFLYFDAFETNDLTTGTIIWTPRGSIENNGIANIDRSNNGDYQQMYTTCNFYENKAWGFNFNKTESGNTNFYFAFISNVYNWGTFNGVYNLEITGNNIYISNDVGNYLISTIWDNDLLNHQFEITKNNSGGFELFIDDIAKGNAIDNEFSFSAYMSFWEHNYIGFDIDNFKIREFINNEPELWTVGNIEYPEALDMNCSLKVITHLTEKEIKIVNMTGDIIDISKSNECINLSYDSYILYMSNPVKISSFTELLNTIDNVFIQFFLFAFLIVIGIIFFTFLQIIKNRGFKGVTK